MASTTPDTSHLRNIGAAERWTTALGGALLVGYGLQRRDAPGLLMAGLGGALALRGASGHSEIYHRLGIWPFDGDATDPAVHGTGVHVMETVTVRRPVDVVYRWWRRLENLPHVMRHLVRVTEISPNLYRWEAKAPLGRTVTWDA
jgi:uncharacterized membrane protein